MGTARSNIYHLQIIDILNYDFHFGILLELLDNFTQIKILFMVHSNIFVIFLNLSFMVSGWVVYVRLKKIVFHESIKYLHWLFLGGFLIFRGFFYRYFCPFRNFEGWANQEAYYQYILIVQQSKKSVKNLKISVD